jgi:type VII secretion integral membrane protein EccD
VEDDRCRITVVGTRRRVDLAVPARAPIAEYVATLTRLCGQETDDTFPASWSLAPAGARPIPPSASLHEADVLDGATLYLRDAVEGEADEPVLTDLEDLVDEVGGWERWSSRHRAFTVIGTGLAAVVAAVAVLVLGSPDASAAGPVALLAGLGAALLAGTAGRRGWPVPAPLRLAVALAAVPLLTLAGYALPVTRQGSGAAVIAAAAGALVGTLLAVFAVLDACTLLVALFAALALPATILLVAVHASLVECAAVAGVVALLVLSTAPGIAGRLVALAPGRLSEVADPVTEIAETLRRGRGVLIALTTLSSAVCAASLLVLGDSDDLFAAGLALCLSLALLAQAGQSSVPVAVMPALAAGGVGLFVLAIRAPVRLLDASAATPALVVGGLGAVVVGAGFVLAAQPAGTPEERPSWLGTAGVLLSVLSAPLAVGVFGVFQHLARMGGRM